MARYARQKNKTNCGPTVLVNALKWAGYQTPYKVYDSIMKKRCGWNPGEGTDVDLLRYALCATPELAVIEEQQKPSLRWIDRALKKGYAVLLCYYHKRDGHFTLIVDKTEHYYVLVNDSWTKAVKRRHKDTMEKMLKFKLYPGTTSNAWSLEAK